MITLYNIFTSYSDRDFGLAIYVIMFPTSLILNAVTILLWNIKIKQ